MNWHAALKLHGVPPVGRDELLACLLVLAFFNPLLEDPFLCLRVRLGACLGWVRAAGQRDGWAEGLEAERGLRVEAETAGWGV